MEIPDEAYKYMHRGGSNMCCLRQWLCATNSHYLQKKEKEKNETLSLPTLLS